MNKDSHSSPDSLLQMKQKLIHYKSEISHYEQKIRQYERALEQEKENTNFWQEKHASILDHLDRENPSEELERKMNMLTNELTEQKLLNEHLRKKLLLQEQTVRFEEKPMSQQDLTAFFMYSVVLPHEQDDDTMIIGNVIIKNQTASVLHAPALCLKIHPPLSAGLSGKIVNSNKQESESFSLQESDSEQWEYAHPNWKEKIRTDGEYWIKPIHTAEFQPESVLSFDSFQLAIRSSPDVSSFLMEGYFYSKEWKQGVPFLNKIIVNFPV
jgi:hypothetical protein